MSKVIQLIPKKEGKDGKGGEPPKKGYSQEEKSALLSIKITFLTAVSVLVALFLLYFYNLANIPVYGELTLSRALLITGLLINLLPFKILLLAAKRFKTKIRSFKKTSTVFVWLLAAATVVYFFL